MTKWGHIREDPNGWEPPRLERVVSAVRSWTRRDPGAQDGPWRDEPTPHEHANTPPAWQPRDHQEAA